MDFQISRDPDGVAVFSIEATSSLIDFAAVEQIVAQILSTLEDSLVKGLVIDVAHSVFHGGEDFKAVQQMRARHLSEPPDAMLSAIVQYAQALRLLERGGVKPGHNVPPKPIAIAIRGRACGIGFHLASACHRIFVAADETARIGCPEIMMGIFPGGGTLQRLVRKLGLVNAAKPLLQARLYSPQRAAALGLVDEVLPENQLLARAKAWVLSDPEFIKPWDRAGFRIPSGAPYSALGYSAFVSALAVVSGRTKGVPNGSDALLSAAYEGMMVAFDSALRVEARWLAKQMRELSSAAILRSAMINRHSLEERYHAVHGDDAKLRRLGVVGMGIIGGVVAALAAQHGIEVVAMDRDRESAQEGKDFALKRLAKAGNFDNLSTSQRHDLASRIQTAQHYEALSECDFVLEAVVEEPRVKKQVISQIEQFTADTTILASSTSTLTLGELTEHLQRPEHLIGFHCFVPFERQGLVEINEGHHTDALSVAKGLKLAKILRKTPIIVKDTPLLFVNRCILPFLKEGIRMIGEGVTPALVENAAAMLGFSSGPLRMADTMSLDVVSRMLRFERMSTGCEDDFVVEQVLHWMLAQDRRGQSSKAGFYDYDDDGHHQRLWPAILRRFAPQTHQPSLTHVQDRLMFAQVLEALNAFDDKVLERLEDGDVAASLGWGFGGWTGGPFNWIDRIGTQTALSCALKLEAECGERFAPPKLLHEFAERGYVYAAQT